MTVSARIQTLRSKHAHLQRTLDDAQRSPGRNVLEISSLKREKMRLKEEITRLES